ncbi:carboxymuconolactone decarboxylase family protein [Flavihumibacter sp. UBA7668]|uniref:carboxymuconolactone decarboxylase family protein n=1 Tax=Flavihumibacter sp. UBA7668 TaxID=1946542 RepID=UPI0025C07178|nr:peroxidase-related enzyme [Flavihumibacter sp. UBA7668]
MPHISLPTFIPGIRSLVIYRPETGKYLYELVQLLLRGDSPLSTGERELIASYVSYLNNCQFCYQSHAAAARCLYGDKEKLVDEVLKDFTTASITTKLKTLLHIAGKVQKLGKEVQPEDIEAARAAGAEDRDIHDTVLIAATFSMFNRYVDGLGTTIPDNVSDYVAMGERMSSIGYVLPNQSI